MSYWHIITFVILLSWFYGCEKNTPTPEIKEFKASFVVINNSDSIIKAVINAAVYYPEENMTTIMYKNLGDLQPSDTCVKTADHYLAYKGCERNFLIDVYKNLPESNIKLHWLFFSGLDTVENYDDRNMVFIWPKDSVEYELVRYDTIPLYFKGGQADYKLHELNLPGRELDYHLK